jgi:hypothetical protein
VARREEKKASNARVLAEYHRSNELRGSGQHAVDVDDPGKWYIDEIICDELVEKESDEPMVKKTRKQFSRRKNWALIAEYYGQCGKKRTMNSFAKDMGNRSDRSADQALKQWLLDYRAKKVSHLTIRAPTYGNDIDALLLTECKARMAAGLPMDDVMLRIMLIGLLALHSKTDLLVENGGKYSFQHGWACRFWKRHNLVSRVVTTKILPSLSNASAIVCFMASVFNPSIASDTKPVMCSFNAPMVNFGFHCPLVSSSGLSVFHLKYSQ